MHSRGTRFSTPEASKGQHFEGFRGEILGPGPQPCVVQAWR